MSRSKNQNFILLYIGSGILLAGLLFLLYLVNRVVPFVNDDIWYSKNLVTEEPLKSLHDIWESQVWHFYNWGGRNITHGILQLVEMQGEVFCDVVNTVMTLVLGIVIVLYARKKNIFLVLTGIGMILAMNCNITMSMLMQSGAANYLYSTCWILLFVLLYLKSMDSSVPLKLPLIEIWILPLGLITGWSNENMGPAAFVVSVFSIFWMIRKKKGVKAWMSEGCVMSLIGCIPLLRAPGNFVRSALISDAGMDTLSAHIENFAVATLDYLIAGIIVTLALLIVRLHLSERKLMPSQKGLLCFAFIAHAAMFVSPTYPDRASFGIFAILTTFCISILSDLYESYPKKRFYILLFGAAAWCVAVVRLVDLFRYPPF